MGKDFIQALWLILPAMAIVLLAVLAAEYVDGFRESWNILFDWRECDV